MTDVIKRRIAKQRRELKDVLPLDTPYVVNIDLSSICNFKCEFCFHSSQTLLEEGFEFGIMDFEVFEKIVCQLGEFSNKIKQVCICGTGEPLINKNIVQMIEFLKKSGTCEYIKLVTNASLLNKNLIDKIIEVGLDEIVISLEGLSAEKYYEVTGYKLDYQGFVENIAYFYQNSKNCIVSVKIIDYLLEDKEEMDRFHNLFDAISHNAYVDSLSPIFEGVDYGKFNHDFKQSLFGEGSFQLDVCPIIFYSLFINYRGEVIPCVVDYKESNSFGNICEIDLKNIWKGLKIKKFQSDHLKKCKNRHAICSNCTYLAYFSRPEDNIDTVAEQLLYYYEEDINESEI